MKDNDLISVIIPVFNMEKYISRCIESLISQTYENIEILIINDGSSDGSLDICLSYQIKDNRIKVLNQTNKGVSEARNNGLDHASGDYIIFVDADDYVTDRYVEFLHSKIVNSSSDIVECGYVIKNEGYKEENKVFSLVKETTSKEEIYNEFFRNKGMKDFLWNKIFKKELFDDIRFSDLKCSEDFEILSKILYKVNKISAVDECLYFYMRTPESVGISTFSEKKLDVIKAREAVIKQYSEKKETEITYLLAVQIVSRIFDLYREVIQIEENEKYKKILKKYFDEYHKLAKHYKEGSIKDCYRRMKYLIFKTNPTIAVKIFK